MMGLRLQIFTGRSAVQAEGMEFENVFTRPLPGLVKGLVKGKKSGQW